MEAPQAMPDPDEDQVALANLDLLIPFGGGQVVGGHVISRLEPGDAAGSGHVQQYTPADDAVGGRGDGELGRSGVGDYVGRPVVVEPAVIDDVAEGVDVGIGVAVDVHADLVHGEGESIIRRAVTGLGHLVPGRFGVVSCHAVLDGAGQGHRSPQLHCASRGEHGRGCEVVQRTPPVSRPSGRPGA